MRHLFLLVGVLAMLSSCGKDGASCSLDQIITFSANHTINICDDMIHEKLQGIDSEYGQFVSSDGTLKIFYDNGALAGNYVQETDAKTIDNAVNQEFWYMVRDSYFIVTFPIESGDPNWDWGSHNLISTNIEQKELILDIAKTFTKK